MNILTRLSTLLILPFTICSHAGAPLNNVNGIALPSGDEIAIKVNERNEGIAVSRKLTMKMTDRRGKSRTRETRTFRKYYGQEKKTAIFYLSPKSVRDTAFLTFDYPQPDAEDDQWLYLPAMRKVRRISASDRGDYFLGTDLTFEEMKLETRISIHDYSRKTIGKDIVDDMHCIIVESLPINSDVAKELGLSKRHDCVDDTLWITRKSEQWDTNGNHLKTVRFKDIRLIDDILTAHIITVKNHKTGHSTKLSFSDVSYNHGVSDDIFTQNSISRGL
ncbi:MAG: hypothetical protein ACI93R_002682 [Flavobacteriales bacterium]|jgi:hypothetical protein